MLIETDIYLLIKIKNLYFKNKIKNVHVIALKRKKEFMYSSYLPLKMFQNSYKNKNNIFLTTMLFYRVVMNIIPKLMNFCGLETKGRIWSIDASEEVKQPRNSSSIC